MSTEIRKPHGRDTEAALLDCPTCSTPTVTGKHCAECGTVATPRHDTAVVPAQREVVIDLTTPGQETRTVVLPSAGAPDGAGPDTDPPPTAETAPAAEQAHTDLLDDLGADAAPDDLAPARGSAAPSRRVGLLAGVGAVALALLLVAGIAGTRYLAGGDTRDALSASTRDFTAVVVAMTAADSAEGVASAADAAPAAAQRIDGQLRRLGRADDAQSRAVVDQLAAEKQLLEALGRLTSLERDPMATWGAAHEPIGDAVAREAKTRATLAAVHADAGSGLPDTAIMMTAVTSAAGTALAESAVSQAGDLLASLGSATTTADLRDAARLASAEQPAVAAVLPALTDGTGRRTLAAYSRALAALAGLASLDGDNASAWSSARADLTAAFGELSGADGNGAVLGPQSSTTFAAVDAMVTRAAGQIADWKASHEAAIADRNSDAEAMTAYVDSVQAELTSYELLRGDLQAFFDRVEDPDVSVTYYEAYTVLSQAEDDRRASRDTLAGLSVPEGMRAQHGELIAVINRAITAVRAGYDGLSQAQDCVDYYCSYRDTPGFTRFQAESTGITKAYAAAVQDWTASSGAVTASIVNRGLPAKPEV